MKQTKETIVWFVVLLGVGSNGKLTQVSTRNEDNVF